MKTFTVRHSNHSYPVYIGHQLFASDLLPSLISQKTCALLADTQTAPLYAMPILQRLRSLGITAHLFTIPSGESNKTRKTKQQIENKMLQQGCDRNTCLIAIGGGMITDLSGFIASTYYRGIPLILIPTTLLAMVDASIGGKNGVNTPQGKNLIGSVYHPEAVVMDTETLATLSEKHLRNGISEILKHALIADPKLFFDLENSLNDYLLKKNLEQLIWKNCQIKQSVIEKDTNEKNLRRILNFGHTIGHALENISDYSTLHGEAVAFGMLIESAFSTRFAKLSEAQFQRIQKLIKRIFPYIQSIPHNIERVISALKYDKKNLDGTPRFVLLDAIGSPASFNNAFCTPIIDFQAEITDAEKRIIVMDYR